MKLIQLTQGGETKVNDEDFDYLNQWKWYRTAGGYAGRMNWKKDSIGKSVRDGFVLMHRALMVPGKDFVIDHIDADRLNNQRSNLRLCTVAENLMNRGKNKNNKSGFKGVVFHQKKWKAEIRVNRKGIYLGVFDTPEEAHVAYCKAAREYHGVFANYG